MVCNHTNASNIFRLVTFRVSCGCGCCPALSCHSATVLFIRILFTSVVKAESWKMDIFKELKDLVSSAVIGATQEFKLEDLLDIENEKNRELKGEIVSVSVLYL